MSKIKNKYSGQLNKLINSKVKGFTFCGMKGCNESPVDDNGMYAEATWGIIIHLENKEDTVFTWCEDKRIGDPFFINVTQTDDFIEIDSLELQDTTALFPWSNYVDKTISNTAIHTYPTNYGNLELWHDVPWGIELDFDGSFKILIGALHHGDFIKYLICADEIVAIFDAELIKSIKKLRSDFKSDWSATPYTS